MSRVRVRRLRQLIQDRSGASAVEYGLILLFGVGLAAGIIYLFGHVLNAKAPSVAVNIENPPTISQTDAGLKEEGRAPDASFILHGHASSPTE